MPALSQPAKNGPAPAVSVLMAVYNCAPFLAAALDSLLAQTFTDFEIVAVDDASTDGTPAILKAYALRDSRFVLIRNDRNLKLPTSLNVGLAVCRASLVARADGDDLYPPTRLEKQFQFLKLNAKVGVVSGYYDRIDAQQHHLGLQKLPLDNDSIKFKLLWESSICHAAAMYRLEIIQSVHGYDTAYPTSQDYDLWVRLMERTKFANLPETMMTVRFHTNSSSALRGAAGANRSASISQRALAAYLGRPLQENSRSLRTLLCAYDAISSLELRPALMLLDTLWRIAVARERPETLRWAKTEIADSLLQQARYRTYFDPANSRILMRKAVAFHKPILCTKRFIVQVIRLLLSGRRRVVAGDAY